MSELPILTPLDPEQLTSLFVRSGAVRVASSMDELVTLRQGIPSGIYVDCGDLLTDPETSDPFVDTIAAYVEDTFGTEPTIVGNVNSKASSLGPTIGRLLKMRKILYSSESVQEAERGTGRRVRLPKRIGFGDTIVVVDDVMTEGDTTASDAIANIRNVLKEVGSPIVEREIHLVTPLLRGDPARVERQLRALKIKPHWFITLEPIVRRLWRGLTPEQCQILMEVDGFRPPRGL